MTIQVPDKPSLEELVHYGVKGMRWGHRKSVDPAKVPLRKRKYSDEEIKAARARQKERAAKYQAAVDKSKRDPDTGKLQYTKAIDDARHNWAEQEDRYVANRNTRGEKFLSILVAGPIGAYMTSDLRTLARVSNEAPVKFKRNKSYPLGSSQH